MGTLLDRLAPGRSRRSCEKMLVEKPPFSIWQLVSENWYYRASAHRQEQSQLELQP
jgi:hypothetical protein